MDYIKINNLYIQVGDSIEYQSVDGHRMRGASVKTGQVVQITERTISIKGAKYPDSILVNDLRSKQAKIMRITRKGEGNMPTAKNEKTNWDQLWPQVVELCKVNMSTMDIAKSLKISNPDRLYAKMMNMSKNGWVDPRKQQAPTQDKVEPDQAANQELEQKEPAENRVPEVEYGCPFDDPNTFNPDPPSFTVQDENPIPYKVMTPQNYIQNRYDIARGRVNLVLGDSLALQLLKEMIQGEIV